MSQLVTISTSWYHSLLRVAVLIFASVLLFESGLVTPVTKDVTDLAGQQLASAVGMKAGVAPNELNVITARLTEKEQQLLAREAALNEREIAVSVGGSASAQSRSTFLLATVLFILLLLIILNYILDYLRSRERELAT